MSSLVNDFLIEPVLRRACLFSRPNAPRDSVQIQQASLTCHDVVLIEDPVEKLEFPDEAQCNMSRELDSLSPPISDSASKAKLQNEDDVRIDGILETTENAMSSSFLSADSVTISTQEASICPDSQQSGYAVSNEDLSHRNPDELPGDNSSIIVTDSIVNNIENEISNLNLRNNSTLGLAEESNQETNHQRNSPLPEDDGMGELRKKIISIQMMDIRPENKARLMHQLLTRDYSEAQKVSKRKKQRMLRTPPTIIKQERSQSSGSLSGFLWQLNSLLDPTAEEQNHIYRLSPDDLKKTYVPFEMEECEESDCVEGADESQMLGCRHYRRNVKLQCSACERWYTCRLCHDEVEDHVLNRKATKNMLCMICGYAQLAGEFCVKCGERTAWYYCDVCKLWDNDPSKNIYHCNDCGICRKGLGIGKDFFHCKTCGTCMSMSVEHSHKCIERVSDCDCPICGEYMFTSPLPVVFMLCGHGIHKACYEEHLKTSYKCPICSKSTINMETQFRNLDRAVISQPMPPEFRDTKAMVSCNDCCAKSSVNYHWLGLKCAICGSYNTAQISIISQSTGGNENQDSSNNSNSHVNFVSSNATSSPPESNMARQRRHSTYVNQSASNFRNNDSILSMQIPNRVSRSISPTRGIELCDDESSPAIETDDSAGESDELDFWGLDEIRSVTSGENADEEIDEDESDEDSILEDCDDGIDEDDDFALFGHR
ncbi:putative chy zinc finger [Golovinomyces cichoracearum]|uniref:Putative chy zinc finger n=1 Tax=Golovinomyces cichoracearum TaxID=62708 RepID=A0A420IF83_9PEZI|nr:putative chy zinc finger [Golovinomyces cichoracearum]